MNEWHKVMERSMHSWRERGRLFFEELGEPHAVVAARDELGWGEIGAWKINEDTVITAVKGAKGWRFDSLCTYGRDLILTLNRTLGTAVDQSGRPIPQEDGKKTTKDSCTAESEPK